MDFPDGSPPEQRLIPGSSGLTPGPSGLAPGPSAQSTPAAQQRLMAGPGGSTQSTPAFPRLSPGASAQSSPAFPTLRPGYSVQSSPASVRLTPTSSHGLLSQRASRVSDTGATQVAAAESHKDRPQDVGRRRDYDICMVFPYKPDVEAKSSRNHLLQAQVMQSQRETVMKNLQNCGLHIYCFYSRDRDEIFCKVGASARKLRDIAAKIKYRLELKAEYLSAYAPYRHDFPGRPEHNYADRRSVSHLYKTHTEDDFPSEDAIFSTRDKIALVHYIITSKDRDCAGINVGLLLHHKELKDYFPLHEERKMADLASDKLAWVMMGKEHATAVRDYFGEKVAFYYLFMSFYWKSLLIPAVLGLACQFLDWVARTPNNISAVPLCIFMAVWTTLLPHFWRRQEAKYAITWGTLDLVPELEPYRPEFWGEQRLNPVTAQVEPYYPLSKRAPKFAMSLVTVILTGVLLVCFVMIYLLLRHQARSKTSGTTLGYSNRIMLYSLFLAVLVEFFNWLLTLIAEKLTRWENHRTQTEYEFHLLMKIMAFKFVNSFFVLYWVAFFKNHANLLGVAMQCYRGDCFLDLQSQLIIFVLVRLTLANSIEYFFPKALAFVRGASERRKTVIHNLQSYDKLELADMSAPEIQAKKEPYESFTDFDETLISHGYATLFAVCAPWVMTLTLIWVVVETVIDVKGLTEVRKRPRPERVRGNEPWTTAFEVYGNIAAVTNITLLVFSSQTYVELRLTERLVLYFYLLHMVYGFKLIVQALFPALPNNVSLMASMQEQMVHRCLNNVKVDAEQDIQFVGVHTNRNENVPVFDQDQMDDDAEDAEPHFRGDEDAKILHRGFKSKGKWCCYLLLVALIVAILITLGLPLFRRHKVPEWRPSD